MLAGAARCELFVVTDEEQRTRVCHERFFEAFDRRQVQVIRGFVEDKAPRMAPLAPSLRAPAATRDSGEEGRARAER